MTRELAFTNARVVMRNEVLGGSVGTVDGVISAVDTTSTRVAGAIDCRGDYLLPGLVELHTDNMERHFTPRPGVDWPGSIAAAAHDAQIAAAGITTVFDAIVIGDIFDERSERMRHLDGMMQALHWGVSHGAFRAEHWLHLRCEVSCPTVVDLFGAHVGNALLRLVSLMDHTPGQRQFVQMGKYRQYYQGKYRLDDAAMDALIARQVDVQQRYGAANRARVLEMCVTRGIPLASHDDATPEHVAEALADRFVLAEFPTTIEAAEAAHAGGMGVLMGAPNVVLGGSHSGNVSATELADRGLLDILSSDYVPNSLLLGAFKLADGDTGWDLPRAVATVSASPAEAAGFGDRGEIALGKRADLIRVRPTEGGPIVCGVWREGDRIA